MMLSQFQKMSKGATEIQKEWIPVVGDLTINDDNRIRSVLYIVTDRIGIPEDTYFVPDMDQLFDLIPYENPVLKISYLHNSFNEDKKYYISFQNIDEYILAVIMKEEHNKVWNFKKEVWVVDKWE